MLHRLGILKYDGQNWSSITLEGQEFTRYVGRVALDTLGNIWFALTGVVSWDISNDFQVFQYGGLYKFNGSTYETFGSNTALSSTDVRKILFDASGNAYFATYGGGLSILKNAVTEIATGLNNKLRDAIVYKFQLNQNYPNPFNPKTNITFSIPRQGRVQLVVYNLLGKKMFTLIDEVLPAGNHHVEFGATYLPSGVYVYQLKANHQVATRKILLIK